MAVSDDDPAAVEIARGLAGVGDEVVGVTLGGGDASWVLARGADRAVVVSDAVPEPTSTAAAATLAAAVRRIGSVDAVVIGDSAWDSGVAACLGGRLGWPVLAAVSTARRDGDRIRATRRVAVETQVVEVRGAVVLAVTARAAEQRPPGMKEILAARRRPVESWALSDLDVAATGSVRCVATRLPDALPLRLIDGSAPESAAAELVAALRLEGVL
jgi:electron transfer flavoprotein beta subunit